MSSKQSEPSSYSSSCLEVKGLTISRNEQVLLENIDLSFTSGSITHLFGENGAGKTSLMRALAGLLNHDSGQICWRGFKTSHPEANFSQDLLFLAHNLAMKSELTIAENLQFYTDLRGKSVSRSEIQTVASELRIESLLERHFAELSAGQQHKVSLSRLVLESAKLWVLDEPFVNLDARTRDWLSDKMMNFAKKGGVVIFTSHQAIDGLKIHQKVSLTHKDRNEQSEAAA
ncbi:heme ABC exporter ATP-binding protein CcmA [Kangiella sp. HZ709]|uniref:heme ABC exporter ATP-binding protein CcmA n=1 Tax=Kangiella sp. HZ709 TaxID=2666328 RepID=UPI0012B0D33B|nr:heme ABC exporter ATP-binding protein CcmA [Kangiella sp. HZ709]MRX26561.1 heme ABC exporter ATP-binding protein CcmA [Kangiella sp. HZ709]